MLLRIQQFLSRRSVAIAWTIFIFILMTIPGKMLPNENVTFIPNLDKYVHATLFGGFVFLWCFYIAFKRKDADSKSRFLTILIMACVYGAATEFIQKYFIPNRDFDLYDIAADVAGAILGYIAVRLVISKLKSLKERKVA